MSFPVPASPVVFVIDNDLAVLSALAFALEAEGYRTCAFRSPARADRSPDLRIAACIVLDQVLPEESGLDFIARLRRENGRPHAILIPSAPPLHVRLAALDMGIPIIEKPLLDDALFAAIRTLVCAQIAESKTSWNGT